MLSKQPSIRAVGQRSIPSSFILDSSNRSKDSKEGVPIKAPNKSFAVSLSDFLDRKLRKSSVLPKAVQGKQGPFSSPMSLGSVKGYDVVENGDQKGSEREMKCVFDKVVFKQFKHGNTKNGEDFKGSCSVGEATGCSTNDMQDSRKRRNPFEGGDDKHIVRKHLVVLGDNPKPKQEVRGEIFFGNKKPKILYNHYANGSGWWDCNMEGIDSEEVGCNEVWEGMGYTTLGGLEWH